MVPLKSNHKALLTFLENEQPALRASQKDTTHKAFGRLAPGCARCARARAPGPSKQRVRDHPFARHAAAELRPANSGGPGRAWGPRGLGPSWASGPSRSFGAKGGTCFGSPLRYMSPGPMRSDILLAGPPDVGCSGASSGRHEKADT